MVPLSLLLLACAAGTAFARPGHRKLDTFTNPIDHTFGKADPWITQHNGEYLWIESANGGIVLHRSKRLTSWDTSYNQTIFTPPPNKTYSTDIWAPELHYMNSRFYVIFTADPHGDNPPPSLNAQCKYACPAVNHRMYVLESKSEDPFGEYELKGMIKTPDVNGHESFAIDGTYFKHKGKLYHVYSCWRHWNDGWPADLCIQKMSNPWTSTSLPTVISVPTEPWEQFPPGNGTYLATNEGPEQLTGPTGKEFIIYSASRSDTGNYCLGQLELVGSNPMSPSSWKKHTQGCVFEKSNITGVYSTGHASYVKSPDGTEDWMVYHAMDKDYQASSQAEENQAWADRRIRTQKFTWHPDGTPNFGIPTNGPMPVPSGQK